MFEFDRVYSGGVINKRVRLNERGDGTGFGYIRGSFSGGEYITINGSHTFKKTISYGIIDGRGSEHGKGVSTLIPGIYK